jgi:hypothetical protein
MMRARTGLSTALVALLVAGAAVPSMAATKRKPKPIKGSFTATGLPDPTPVAGDDCVPTLPTSKTEKAFTVPARGILHVEAANTLDWSVSVLTADGEMLACADGGTPTDKEMTDVTFKKKTKVILRAANFAGEPTVNVSYVFTYK